jgi:hypothetical protein
MNYNAYQQYIEQYSFEYHICTFKVEVENTFSTPKSGNRLLEQLLVMFIESRVKLFRAEYVKNSVDIDQFLSSIFRMNLSNLTILNHHQTNLKIFRLNQ